MSTSISRRDFLKLSGAGLLGLAFRKYTPGFKDINIESDDLARVAIRSVSIYSRPDDKSSILYQRYRDELLNIYADVISEFGPGYNPLWHRVWRGYVHSAHMQRVKYQLNPITENFSAKGQLGEISVPYVQSYRYNIYTHWQPEYRLYYQSTHWVMGIDVGPDSKPWYRLKDELLDIEYLVPADHVRLIQPEELTPISPTVPSGKKRIEISLARQMLKAYENDQVVLETKIASGIPDPNRPTGQIPTSTPTGEFNVYSKMPSKHMGDGNLTSDLNAYELPGVPWACFFAPNGVATHGTYWHNNFGVPMSHGCINMRTEEARWIFRWTNPVTPIDKIETTGLGTRVIVT